jgi:hypothetical protein
MEKYHTAFKFDTVLILDSLPLEEDPQTGVWLRDTVLQPLADVTLIRFGGQVDYAV